MKYLDNQKRFLKSVKGLVMQLFVFYNISKNDIFVLRNHFNRHLESGKTNSFAGLLDFFEYFKYLNSVFSIFKKPTSTHQQKYILKTSSRSVFNGVCWKGRSPGYEVELGMIYALVIWFFVVHAFNFAFNFKFIFEQRI